MVNVWTGIVHIYRVSGRKATRNPVSQISVRRVREHLTASTTIAGLAGGSVVWAPRSSDHGLARGGGNGLAIRIIGPHTNELLPTYWSNIKALIYMSPVDYEEDLIAPIVEAASWHC